jgi:hypothetical protein
MTERGMREVVGRPLWQLPWPSEKGSFGWFWERKSKAKGAATSFFFFFFCRDRENLKAFCVPFLQKFSFFSRLGILPSEVDW